MVIINVIKLDAASVFLHKQFHLSIFKFDIVEKVGETDVLDCRQLQSKTLVSTNIFTLVIKIIFE